MSSTAARPVMALGIGAYSRTTGFERMEARMMLAADLPGAGDAAIYSPGEMWLPGSISGTVSAAPDLAEPSAGGPGISGVVLELLDQTGAVVAAAVTDDAGAYEFPVLEPGVYSLRQQQPTGFDDVESRVGNGGGTPLTSNFISEIVVGAGAMLEDYDFLERLHVLVQPGHVDDSIGSFAQAPLLGYLAPPSIAWPRPTEALPPAPVAPPLAPVTPTAVAAVRREEPIFGGSSAPLEDSAVGEEAGFREADEQALAASEQLDDAPVQNVRRRIAQRSPSDAETPSARDHAFEQQAAADEAAEADGAVEADAAAQDTPPPPAPRTYRVARKPAA